MKRYVVYTALVGSNYDKLLNLACKSEDFDYICFVKKGAKSQDYENGWKIEEIDSDIEDNGRLSRVPKLLPHKTIVKKYEYSLYIDANINIKGESIYKRFLELAATNKTLAMLRHPFRDCVYQEAFVCIAACKGGWLDILRQIFFLKRKGIQKHSGLYEANLIFRKHNEDEIRILDELWWRTFMTYSKRDQLSLIYALKESGLQPSFFLESGLTTRNHPDLEKVQHKKQHPTKSTNFKQKIVSITYGLFKPLLKEEKIY